MCFFLTVAVPKKFAGRMGEAFGRGFQSCRTANPGITSALPLNFEARLILSGMCSCDLCTRPKRDSVDPVERLRQRYAQRGWSRAKTERAIAQSVAKASRRVKQP
ncbi:MAG TPA: hypothetical protein VFB80_03085, partial [Pirellulaceae bacterium]|nr:hypothetical protein [Pirellulaceae bacterium]